MDNYDTLELVYINQAEYVSEMFEKDSRRYPYTFTEQEEATLS